MSSPNHQYTDLDLSFRQHPIRNEVVEKKDSAAINQALLNLLYRDRRAVPFEPEREINIRSLLFEPMSNAVAASLESRIKLVVAQFEPRISLISVQAIPYMAQNRYQVVVQYQITGTSGTGELKHLFDRVG